MDPDEGEGSNKSKEKEVLQDLNWTEGSRANGCSILTTIEE